MQEFLQEAVASKPKEVSTPRKKFSAEEYEPLSQRMKAEKKKNEVARLHKLYKTNG